MADPTEILAVAIDYIAPQLQLAYVETPYHAQLIEQIAQSPVNRACVRLILACALAKYHRPEIDITKPYTEIGTADAFSGRTYDELYITPFILAYQLPCNTTTAFLTPALRNRNQPLDPQENVQGRPKELYQMSFQLLVDVQSQAVDAEAVLYETIRQLLIYKTRNDERLALLLQSNVGEVVELAVEDMLELLAQHLQRPKSSRLPVLMIAAMHNSLSQPLGKYVLPMQAHNAADRRTGALGDLEIALAATHELVTLYEIKAKTVTTSDIDIAVQKLAHTQPSIQHYLFITTEPISDSVTHYARSFYTKLGGIEIAVLDCLAFIRHCLFLFPELRLAFLDEYQRILLAEPASAVRQQLKEVFLTLRQDAESALNDDD